MQPAIRRPFFFEARKIGNVQTRFAGKKYRQMYGKLEKLTERLLAKPHPPNVVNTIFYLVF